MNENKIRSSQRTVFAVLAVIALGLVGIWLGYNAGHWMGTN